MAETRAPYCIPPLLRELFAHPDFDPAERVIINLLKPSVWIKEKDASVPLHDNQDCIEHLKTFLGSIQSFIAGSPLIDKIELRGGAILDLLCGYIPRDFDISQYTATDITTLHARLREIDPGAHLEPPEKMANARLFRFRTSARSDLTIYDDKDHFKEKRVGYCTVNSFSVPLIFAHDRITAILETTYGQLKDALEGHIILHQAETNLHIYSLCNKLVAKGLSFPAPYAWTLAYQFRQPSLDDLKTALPTFAMALSFNPTISIPYFYQAGVLHAFSPAFDNRYTADPKVRAWLMSQSQNCLAKHRMLAPEERSTATLREFFKNMIVSLADGHIKHLTGYCTAFASFFPTCQSISEAEWAAIAADYHQFSCTDVTPLPTTAHRAIAWLIAEDDMQPTETFAFEFIHPIHTHLFSHFNDDEKKRAATRLCAHYQTSEQQAALTPAHDYLSQLEQTEKDKRRAMHEEKVAAAAAKRAASRAQEAARQQELERREKQRQLDKENAENEKAIAAQKAEAKRKQAENTERNRLAKAAAEAARIEKENAAKEKTARAQEAAALAVAAAKAAQEQAEAERRAADEAQQKAVAERAARQAAIAAVAAKAEAQQRASIVSSAPAHSPAAPPAPTPPPLPPMVPYELMGRYERMIVKLIQTNFTLGIRGFLCFADLNRRTEAGLHFLHIAVAERDMHTLQTLLAFPAIDIHARDPDGKTALHLAADRGDRDTYTMLLEHGATTTYRDARGMVMALVDHKRQTVLHTILLSLKISPSQQFTFVAPLLTPDVCLACLNTVEDRGLTPLIIASARGYADVVKVLIKCGAEVNFENRGRSALRFAVSIDYTTIAPDAQDRLVEVINILLEHKANPFSVCPGQSSIGELARTRGFPKEIVEKLTIPSRISSLPKPMQPVLTPAATPVVKKSLPVATSVSDASLFRDKREEQEAALARQLVAKRQLRQRR